MSKYKSKNIFHFLNKWFEENHNIIIKNNDDRYIEYLEIDSFDVINLIECIETNFQINFSSNELQDPSIFTVNGLVSMIAKKLKYE